MPTRRTELDDMFWPERDEPDDETRTVIALLSFIRGGLGDGQKALARAAAQDAGVPETFALAVLHRHTGCRAGSDHFWEARRVSGRRLQYRLLPPA